MPRPGAAVTDAERALVGRALRQPRGRYVAERASQLSGIPARTLHDWATSGTLVPDWAGARPRAWSYRDVVYARLLAWLRSKGMDRASAAARVAQLRAALADPPAVPPLLAEARPRSDDLPDPDDGRPGVALGPDVATAGERRPADDARDPAGHGAEDEPSPGGGAVAEVAPDGGGTARGVGVGTAPDLSDVGGGDGAGDGTKRGAGVDEERRTGGPTAQGVGGGTDNSTRDDEERHTGDGTGQRVGGAGQWAAGGGTGNSVGGDEERRTGDGTGQGAGGDEERPTEDGPEHGVGGDEERHTGDGTGHGLGGDGEGLGPRVHSDGHVLLVGDEVLDRFSGQQAFAGVTGMLDAFSLTEPVEGVSRSGLWGPSLVRPSAHTTISPYTLGGEPCVAGSRVPTALLRALHVDRGLDVEAIRALYPFLSAEAIADALALEERLRAA